MNLPAKEAARAIGVCPKRLRELVRLGMLPAPGVDGTYPIDAVQTLMDYYDKRREATAKGGPPPRPPSFS